MSLDKKKLPIGYEDFKEIIDKDLYYIDKTMFIYELINNGGKNNLITRPRRFGKTLNFSMLKYFFDITEKDNAYLFDGLKISRHHNEIEQYRNTHPVIIFSMKSAKQRTYELALDSLCCEIQAQYHKYRFILDSDKLTDAQKKVYNEILCAMDKDEKLFKQSIGNLCIYLKQYYEKNTIILIDEYDVPLESAYFSGYYEEMVGFIRSLFESALKTNPALEFSVITGCLRVSKESIFTGLNNLVADSILSEHYSECFGFEEYEVIKMLQHYGFEDKLSTFKRWYDGYLFGKTEIYNPWSIVNYVYHLTANPDAYPVAAWINSSSNSIIRELVNHAEEDTREIIENLMSGGAVNATLNETVTYGDLTAKSENIWSFLFFTGYLKVKTAEHVNDETTYSLVIPNIEIRQCYKHIILEYFNAAIRNTDNDKLYEAFLNKDTDSITKQLNTLMKRTISYYDTKEAFYHGLLTGLLSRNSDYRVESNRETGDGRSDIILYQEGYEDNAIILELKVCKKSENIRIIAAKALEQINERDYAAEARNLGYVNIFKYGIAFKGKFCCVTTE